jgi:transposase
MKHRRSFAIELKRQIIEELLSGLSTPAQLIRRYEISSGLFYHWKKNMPEGDLIMPPARKQPLRIASASWNNLSAN